MPEIDLQQLAIDRDSGSTDPQSGRPPRQVLSRYVLPGSVVVGFVLLAGWMGWDLVFPPRDVTVVQLLTSRSVSAAAGQPVFQASGWIEPRPTSIRVAALAAGVVEKLLVVENQAVEAGEPIAMLVADDATLSLEASEATLSLRRAEELDAQAVLTAAEVRLAQPVHLEAPLGAAAAQLAGVMTQLKSLPFEKRQAEADLVVARADHSGKLAARGVVAEIEIARAKAVLERAEATLEELVRRIESLSKERAAWQQQVVALTTRLELLADETEARDQARARLRAATSRVAVAGVKVAESRLQLDRMTVIAPAAGRVYQLVVAPGSRIGAGMIQMQGHDGSTVVTMYQPERLQVRVDVRFSDLPQVVVNQPVEINNPALPKPLSGRVLLVSSIADIQKNTLEVKVVIDEPPSLFKPDMLVDITFLSSGTGAGGDAGAEQSRHFLPRALVRSDDQGSYVWLADQARGRVRRVAVTLGVGAPGGLVEVVGSLSLGSRVVAGGAQGLVDGQRIRISGEEPEAAYSDGAGGGAVPDGQANDEVKSR
jgi:multidrug efflux pump subunit AcrA (membrane-fusion protein)